MYAPFLTLLVILPVFFVTGIGLQWFFNKFEVSEFNSLLVSFGLFIILQAVMTAFWTADYRLTIYVLHYTYTGKALRAISQDRDMAAAFGVNYQKMSMLLMGVSTVYAGVAGVFMAIDLCPFSRVEDAGRFCLWPRLV